MARLFWEIRDAVVVGDATTGHIALWNPAAERRFGYRAEEAIGHPIEMLMPEAVRERHRAGLADYRATGHGQLVDGGVPVEVPAARKDGRDITIELTLTPISGGVDKQRFVLAMIRDVTERRRTRDDLARQAALLDLAHDAVLVRDLATSRILYWSRGAERLYGWTRDEAMGQITHALLQTRSSKPLPEKEAELLRTGHWEGELVHISREGRAVVVDTCRPCAGCQSANCGRGQHTL